MKLSYVLGCTQTPNPKPQTPNPKPQTPMPLNISNFNFEFRYMSLVILLVASCMSFESPLASPSYESHSLRYFLKSQLRLKYGYSANCSVLTSLKPRYSGLASRFMNKYLPYDLSRSFCRSFRMRTACFSPLQTGEYRL